MGAFVIAYGAWVWASSLVALVAIGVPIAWWMTGREARRNGNATRGALGAPSARFDPARVGEIVTLSGTLRSDGAAARFEDGRDAAAASAAPAGDPPILGVRARELALETNGARVSLEGAVDVVVGSREAWPRRAPERLPASVRARMDAAGGAWAGRAFVVFRSVADGDAVIARGLLRKSAAAGEGHYREAAVTYSLGPRGSNDGATEPRDEVAIEIASARPPAVAPAWRRVLPVGMAIGFALFAVGFLGVPAVLDATDESNLIRLATPWRKDALEALAMHYEQKLMRARVDAHSLDMLVAVQLERRESIVAAQVLLDHQQWKRATEIANRTTRPLIAAQAAFDAGDFERAGRTWDGIPPDTLVGSTEWSLGLRAYLFAGDAAAARRAIEVPRRKTSVAFERDKLDCLAAALDERLGARGALERVRGAQGTSTLDCEILRADASDGDTRNAALIRAVDRARTAFGDADEWALRALLAGRSGARVVGIDALLRPAKSARIAALVKARLDGMLARTGLAANDRAIRASLARSTAAFDSACGEHDAAIRMADVALDDATATGQDVDEARLLWLAVRVRARKWTPEETAALSLPEGEGAAVVRTIAARAVIGPGVVRPDDDRKRALAAFIRPESDDDDSEKTLRKPAVDGDGSRFAEALWHKGYPPERLVTLTALTNRDERGRAELLNWARFGEITCPACFGSLSFMMATERLAVAELLGDEALAAELRPTVKAFCAAFSRRDLAVPLALLEGP